MIEITYLDEVLGDIDILTKVVGSGFGNPTMMTILPDGTGLASATASGEMFRTHPRLRPTPPSQVATLLNGFLEARIAGGGAEQYLNDPDVDIPLLYATTSGAPYERAEFERVPGIEWPYGWTGFQVRLFAGDTVVDQLVFTSPEDPGGLEYQPHGFGTHIAPTTEDGQPVAVSYTYFDGEVTLHAAHPWIFHDGWAGGRLIPEGPDVRPTTDGGERRAWDSLVLQVGSHGPPCQASVCDLEVETGRVLRYYRIDAPEGSSMQTLTIVLSASTSSFERAAEAAAPVIDSIEFAEPRDGEG